MAENSNIEWTDHTFNPWMGCTKVSAGCKHCYAEEMMDKRYGKVQWGPMGRRVRTSPANWKLPHKWNKAAVASNTRPRVFCASLADVFENHPDQPEMHQWRADLFQLIEQTPNLDWLLLTKRPHHMLSYQLDNYPNGFPANVWVGTSVEDQNAADERIPLLVNTRAVVHFLSAEPLLGPINLDLEGANYGRGDLNEMVNWVIVGGESGKDARPMHQRWVRSLRDQCTAAKVAFFFKQHGEWIGMADIDPIAHGLNHPRQSIWEVAKNDPNDLPVSVYRVGKKAAGRLLDGREWNELPTPREVAHA